MIHLRLLGTVDLRDDEGHEIEALLSRPKRLALLAYLAAADPPGFQRRDTLLALFWPEIDLARGRDALNQALRFLRQSVGREVIMSRGSDEVGLEPERVRCDVAAFRAALSAGRPADALELYRGDLLAGFFLDDARPFEDWVERERTALRRRAASAARSLAEQADRAHNVTMAVRWARRALTLDSDDERAVRRLLAILAGGGDRAGALLVYDEFVRRLRVEYDAEPAAETKALVDAIRSGATTRADEQLASADAAPLASCSTLADGRYVIERELGRGAMATIYLVHDRREDRRVALKMVDPNVTTERFHREIGIAARLDHHHILPLFDSGNVDGCLYFTMPFVEGASVRDRLRRERQLPLDDALDIARQVASALDYAHQHGVVHRDIKPENILLHHGRAVVTDFGIAGAIDTAGGVSVEALTRTGILLGTPYYMSPEQATGDRQIDGRSDVYSLGCVLYEMLAGEPPYTGPTIQAVFARHALAPVPSLRTVRPNVPAAVDHAVARALAKSPADRFRTAGELAAALTAPVELSSPPRWQRAAIRASVAAIVVVAVGLAAFAFAHSTGEPAASAPPVRRQLTYVGNALQATVSPDGQFIAYLVPASESYHVVVQDLAGGSPDTVATVSQLFGVYSLEWSPDGTRLLWGTVDEAVVLPRLGGALRRITAAGALKGWALFAQWLPDGSHISLHPDGRKRILVVDLATEDTVSIRVGGEYDFMFDGSWSPDGRLYAVATLSENPFRSAIRIVSRDGQTEVVAEDSVYLGSPHWSADGGAVYFARGDNAIWQVDVSPRTGRRRGDPREVHTQIEALRDLTGRVEFSLTRDGRRMVYARGAQYSNIWVVDSSAAERKPRLTPLTTGTALRWSPVVSPDGRWIAFAQEANGVAELFRMSIDGGSASQLTFGARVWRRSWIAWSPDGRELAFTSVRAGRAHVWVVSLNGGQPRALERTRITTGATHLAWAPGARIAYQTPELNNIDLVDPQSGVVRSVGDTTFCCYYFPQYSPDGGRLAVFRQRPANHGIWVYRLRDSSWTQVADSMLFPRGWSADGRYVYAQLAWKQPLYRVEAADKRSPQHVVTAPFREVECAPAGPFRFGAFVCVAFDFVSDIWMIDSSNSRSP